MGFLAYGTYRVVDVLFFVSAVHKSKRKEHPTIKIVDQRTVRAVLNFEKRLLGRRLSETISNAMNFSTDSARYAAYDSIGQEVSSSPVARNISGNYLPSIPQIVHLPMQIKKNQPTIHHFS